ncbi:hypothetical protein GCL60_06930 [Silvanigrella paludirubra]|uniref:Uncharacterized protein n=1 Tax=Silvanigrella paludirubra TaxID=2499159 RepID=A0A6N6VV96_9BACT|nr:hypothetical protein [Silvanigrella paludirubra]KAB8039991.1 hypothetical protein GCL60_06930 [Silvanigrella paludirubra]
MSMLFSIDSLMQLNLPLELYSFAIVFYWVLSGAIVQSLFIKIDKYLPVGFSSPTIETSMTRRLFYFIAGGAILPMIIVLFPPVFLATIIGKHLEEKVNRKSL